MNRRSVSRLSLQRAAQQGAVLFVAMMFLLLLALLGVAATGTAVMQERMAGGARNSQLGLIGAESTLRETEFYLWNLANMSTLSAGGLQFFCGPEGLLGRCFTRNRDGGLDPRVLAFRNGTGPATFGVAFAPRDMAQLNGALLTARLASQPYRIIEDLGPLPKPAALSWKADGVIYPEGSAASPESLHIYRITARSNGGSDAVRRTVESTFVALTPKSFIAGNENN